MRRFAGVSILALGLAFASSANAEDWKPGFMVRASTNLDWTGNSLYPNDPLFEGGTLGSWGGQGSSLRLDDPLSKLPTESLAFAPAVFDFVGKFTFREPGSYKFGIRADVSALETAKQVNDGREDAVWNCSAVGTMAGQYSLFSVKSERFGYGAEKGRKKNVPSVDLIGDSAFDITKPGDAMISQKVGCFRSQRDFTLPMVRLPGKDRLMVMPDRSSDDARADLVAFPKITLLVSKDGEPFRPIRNDEILHDASMLKAAGVAVVKADAVKAKDGANQGFIVTKGTAAGGSLDSVAVPLTGAISTSFAPIIEVPSGSSIELKTNLLTPKACRCTVAVAVSKQGPDRDIVRDFSGGGQYDKDRDGPGAKTPAAVFIQLGDKVAKGMTAPARDSSELVILDQEIAEPSAAPLTFRIAVPDDGGQTRYKVRLLMIGADDALLRQIRQVDVMYLTEDLPENLRHKAPATSPIKDGKAAVFTVK